MIEDIRKILANKDLKSQMKYLFYFVEKKKNI
jgi:hypothetical protein